MNGSAGLRILLLEDDAADAELIAREIARAGLAHELETVRTGEAFQAALAARLPDLVLSDNTITGYDGMSAMKWTLDHAPGVPFIFVSGTIGEEAAIRAMREGAADCVHKDRLARLGPVIDRARHKLELERELLSIREQHIRGQKLLAMGAMAGGVAHDFRNILSAILGHAELLLPGLPAADPGRIRVGTILAAAQRGVELCAQLVSFGRQGPVSPVSFDPVVEIRRTEALFRSMLTSSITLTIDARAAAGCVCMDPGQFGQVMMNLLVNARDAMPDGGTLDVVVTGRTLVEPETCVASVAVPGPYVDIAVNDTGIGMSEEQRARIFEPYFTTKGAAGGTGLGLAIVYGIIRKAGGHLQLVSVPGRGTSMRIMLPEVVAPLRAASPAVEVVIVRKTILVADDDPVFRDQIGQVLELSGFDVLLAGDGVEALESAGRHPGPIVLLLTDLHMPRMEGWELAGEFARVRPGAGIMVMTGGAESEDGSRGPSPYPLLRKPFSPGELLVRVQEILGRPA